MPTKEQFGLSSQLQRCAVSIPSNIAEGQQRNGIKDYKQFLGVARGSAGELETQLLLIKDIYGLDVSHAMLLVDEVQRMLNTMLSKL